MMGLLDLFRHGTVLEDQLTRHRLIKSSQRFSRIICAKQGGSRKAAFLCGLVLAECVSRLVLEITERNDSVVPHWGGGSPNGLTEGVTFDRSTAFMTPPQ